MKKKVRIYKSPNGDGKYINKTSQFLAKAQMGGTPDPSMLSYPGAQQAQQEDPTNQLIQLIVNDISTQTAKEETLFKLINVMGIAADAAAQLYETIAEQVTQDIEKADDDAYEEETGMKREKSERLSKNEVITQRPEEDVDYDYDLNDDTGSDMALETSNEPDVLDEALDPLSEEYKYGGAYQGGGEYTYALPSPEEYAQYNPTSGYELASNMAWQSPVDTEDTADTMNYANTTLDYTNLQKGGSYKKAKKKYVSSVMNLLKKQMGGQEGDSENPNNGDPTGANFRENKLQAFTNTVKQNAQMQAMQNQIEQQYDQIMQEGGMIQNDPENPMHHLNLYSQTASGIFGEPMNEMVQAKEGLNVPKGFYRRTMKRFGNMPNLREVDVRKSGLFGTPRQYTAYFDPMPLQQLDNPIAAEMYGYGASQINQRKQKRTWDAEKVYTNLLVKETNEETLKEVDKNTPGNDATKVEEKTITQETYVKPTVKSKPNVKGTTNAIPVKQVVRDAWGRPEGSEWFGFNPKTKQWDNGSKPVDFTPGLTKIKNDIESYVPFNQGWNTYLNSIGLKQIGGSVNDPFADPTEPLQRFIGGGMEGDIDYTNSIDTTDPYFQRGGLIKQFVPANLVRNRQNDVVQKIYNPVTGESRPGMAPGAGNYISAIDVRKSSMLGTPKKYTVYYGAQGDPRYENLITLDGSGKSEKQSDKQAAKSAKQQALENAGYGQRTDVTGLKGKSKRAIRQGERQRDRELEKLYKEDPTSVEFDPINIEAPFDRTASNNRAYNPSDLSNPTTEEDFATWGTPREAMETQTAYQFPEGDYNDDASWGMPQDMVVGPADIPVNTQAAENTPAPIAKPETGKQTEEFCFGNSCFEVPDQQKTEYDLFYQTPSLFSSYGRKNNSPWFNAETGEVDLSQVDAETARKIIKEGIPNDIVLKDKSFDDANIDAYSDAWLKYSQGNQEAYGSKSWDDLHADRSALPSQGLAEKYADFLNVTGQTAEGKPFSIWDTTGPLQQTAEQAAARSIQAPYMKTMTSDFGPTSMEGPMSTAEDQVPTFEEQYMEGFQPTITRDMIDQASGLRIPQEPVDMGAWSGMSYPGMPIEPGLNPFDLPVGGGQDYYSPFAQPIAARNDQSINRPAPSGPTLEQVRNQQRNNSNAGQKYTFKPNMTGVEKDPDYRRAMQNARKDGIVTNEEAENATRIFKQKQAEQEKAKVASQAQRTINQIMNSSASTAEKNKAREKVVQQMQQRWDVIDRAANSRKYGGALSRFVNGGDNQSFIGENPVAYTNNPAMQGKSDLDLISLNSGIQGAQGQVNWGQLSPTNTVTQQNNDGTKSYGVDASYKGTQPTEIKVDPMQQEEYQVAKTYSEPLAIDVKNKLTQGEIEARLNTGNALMRGITGIKNRRTDAQQMEGFYDNFSADNLYASDPSRDRGDYAESGLYRPDEQGQVWNSRSAQYGGYIGEDPDYVEGDETYMTEEEIRQYMAQGGQIEFI